ncbi:MAG: DNA-directed RNA polymerase subunit alpha [Thermoguttaceae bacterium]|nr:DNA-directed RNA polymerase subunit alpha [Thermoguttaceae bacterium]MBR4751905.1 DNA-directed RNA polymerase subunit alpha [Thermoguttaceae bacterium]MBR5757387.1 DNA-directed RNA polymerase subunit alpha [Thermoguttaceae bacterium]
MKIRWRGLELPTKVECIECTPTYGKFVAEPFERGFGVTIGNSLRRVLLSSLEGSAVTKMKLRGANLEFTSLPGVMEDVTEIVLNVKSLVVRSQDDKPSVIRVEKNKKGVITGADVITDHQVEVINKDLVIATLTDDVQFSLEMVVEMGRGYVPATEQSSYRDRNEDIGHIPLDASFSPVVKVQYSVEETRVGQKTNYDRLVLQIWTDGSTDPEMALTEASKILRKHLNPFIQYNSAGGAIVDPVIDGNAKGVDPELNAKLSKSITDLKLSVRASNCLEGAGIRSVRELVAYNSDQLLQIKNFGETSLNEVCEKLAELDSRIRLGMQLD